MTSSGVADPKWFRQVLGQYPTGVCVVTASPADEPRAGFVVGSFTSVSLDPPLVAFFPDKGSSSWPKIERAGKFCINILGADQEHLCRRFASKAEDKFDGIEWREAESGSPIISNVVAWVDCDLDTIHDAGDHYIVLGRVRALDIENASLPLLFFQGGYGRFAPQSLAASNRGGDLTDQLRDVDLVRAEMERLADDLSARCISTAVTDGALVVTASAGGSYTNTAATLVGQRLPFGPPTGASLAAWMDPAAVEDWLAPIASAETRRVQRDRLAVVRQRGYSVGLLNEAQRRFASTLDRMAAEPTAVSHEELSGMIPDLSYDPIELSAEVKNDIRIISAPVFRRDGSVALALSLYGFGNPAASGGIDRYLDRVREASEQATERLGGHAPAVA